MTRRRARRSTSEKIEKAFFPKNSCEFKSVAVSSYTVSSANPFVLVETKLHSLNGLNNSSLTNGKLTSSIVNVTALTTGVSQFVRQCIKSIKFECYFENNDSIAKVMNIMPVPYLMSGALTTSSGKNLSAQKGIVKSFILAKNGSAGDCKKISFTLKPWQIEGYENFGQFLSNQNYWSTNNTIPTQFSSIIIQSCTIDAATANTNGVSITANMEFTQRGIQNFVNEAL